MNLRRRLQTVFYVILAMNAIIGTAYVGNIFLLESQLSRARGSAESLRSATNDLASCLLSLETSANGYLQKPSSQAATTFDLQTDACSERIKALSPKFISLQMAEDLKARLVEFRRVITQVGTRRASAMNSLSRTQSQVSQLLPKIGGLKYSGKYVSTLSSAMLLVSSSIVGHTDIDRTQLEKWHTEISSVKALRPEIKEEVSDALTDLLGAGAIWNRALEQERFELKQIEKSVRQIPSELSSTVLQSFISEISDMYGIFRVSGIISLILLPLCVVFVASLRNWVFKTWSQTMGSLKESCLKILSGDTDPFAAMKDVEPESSDEVGITVQAIRQTLGELAELKQSLERKVEERTQSLQQAQGQLVQSAKLAGLGTLSAGVAHELNNPLQIISLMAEQIGSQELPQEKRKSTVEGIQKQISRMSRIIEQLKRMARKNNNDFGWVSLRSLVENALVLGQSKIKNQGVSVAVGDIPELEIYCNSINIESVISNLTNNAADAFETTGFKPESSPNITISSDLNESGDLVVSVKDNGPGIPESIQKRVFEPFFTTKDIGKGTGLGLSMCYQIAGEHGGSIWFDTQDGKGTTFHIKFPKNSVRQMLSANLGAAA